MMKFWSVTFCGPAGGRTGSGRNEGVSMLKDEHMAQSLNYLRATGLEICLLIIWDYQGSTQTSSPLRQLEDPNA